MTDQEVFDKLFADSLREGDRNLDWIRQRDRAQQQLWESLTDDERQQWLSDYDADIRWQTETEYGWPRRR